MLVSKKETFTAEQFEGTFESLVRLITAFPDAVFKVYMDDGKLNVEIKIVPYAQDYVYINHGEWVVYEPEEGYIVHSQESFAHAYRVEAKVEVNDSESIWRHTDEHAAALYDG